MDNKFLELLLEKFSHIPATVSAKHELRTLLIERFAYEVLDETVIYGNGEWSGGNYVPSGYLVVINQKLYEINSSGEVTLMVCGEEFEFEDCEYDADEYDDDFDDIGKL